MSEAEKEKLEVEIEGGEAEGQKLDLKAGDTPDKEKVDAERKEYSDGVQRRIDELTKKFREEQRLRQEAEKDKEEAFTYAVKAHEEMQNVSKKLEAADKTYGETTKSQMSEQLEAQKKIAKKALEEGDSDTLVNAQAAIASLSARIERNSDRDFYVAPKYKEPPKPKKAVQTQEAPEVSVSAKKWMDKNPWFGQDKALTGYTLGVHDDLVNSKGIEVDSNEYYTEIDKALKATFPAKFESTDPGQSSEARGQSPVAPATRQAKSGARVTLTASEAALAKRLGISKEVYAEQKVKLQRGDN